MVSLMEPSDFEGFPNRPYHLALGRKDLRAPDPDPLISIASANWAKWLHPMQRGAGLVKPTELPKRGGERREGEKKCGAGLFIKRPVVPAWH